jgi:general secretion pathway protein J
MMMHRQSVELNGAQARGRHSRGFTLIELLVALLIFVLLAVMSYGGLRTVLDAQQGFERHSDRLAELQMLFLMMGRDIEQTVDRPIRDNFGDSQPALLGGDEGLELSRAGRRNPTGLARSQLQRVGWVFQEGQLLRQSWAVLDRAQDSEAISHVMAEQVKGLEFRFLDQQGQWGSQWPATDSSEGHPALPRAVEVNVDLDDWGMVTRLYRVSTLRSQPEKKG